MNSILPFALPAAIFTGRRSWRCRLLSLLFGLATILPLYGGGGPIDLAALPPPKHATVPKLSGPVKIDGELDEAVWSKAVALQPFFQNEEGGPEREHTVVRLWYDDQALYLGWTCQDMDIHATFTNRDSHFWEEECVECFITPTPKDLTKYFEIEWNPLNGVFDATISVTLGSNGVSRGFKGDWSYTASGMTNAVKVKGKFNGTSDKDEYWQVEVRLPFSDLGVTAPKPGDVWRANFYRFNRTTGLQPEQLSWSPVMFRGGGFHQPSRFGYLEFGPQQ